MGVPLHSLEQSVPHSRVSETCSAHSSCRVSSSRTKLPNICMLPVSIAWPFFEPVNYAYINQRFFNRKRKPSQFVPAASSCCVFWIHSVSSSPSITIAIWTPRPFRPVLQCTVVGKHVFEKSHNPPLDTNRCNHGRYHTISFRINSSIVQQKFTIVKFKFAPATPAPAS